MVASGMLLSSREGIYTAVSSSMVDGQMITKTMEYGSMYQNAILVAVGYTLISVLLAAWIMKKQEYK